MIPEMPRFGGGRDGTKSMLSKQNLIAAGFALFETTKLHRLVKPWTQGQGAILMFHHVRPWSSRDFAPNRLLEITPDFLNAVLTRVKALGFDIISMDQALARLGTAAARPFVVLTFDDGYRDLRDHALPVLEKHAAPFTLYVTTGFADRSARLWWVELEEAIRALPKIDLTIGGQPFAAATQSDEEKSRAFDAIYGLLRDGPEELLLETVAQLAAQAPIDAQKCVEDLCLDWEGIAAIADHPLGAIGVHTLTHPMLAKHDLGLVRRELTESRDLLEEKLGRPMQHLAYPVGDPTSAGPREFALAEELQFASAVTTRPGMIFPEHDHYRFALPRLSINGLWQRIEAVDVLLSGAPFALWNRGRHVSAA
jgi:peptidoglycan/xylan/chitin deacetylase (PgdA/CDA1 family)